jgi:hypothetical protein
MLNLHGSVNSQFRLLYNVSVGQRLSEKAVGCPGL